MNTIFQQAVLSFEQGNLDRAERQFPDTFTGYTRAICRN